MAIIYAIITSNFSAMDLKMKGELEGIQSVVDLVRYKVGSSFNAGSAELRGRRISPSFRTFASHTEVFQALLDDEIQVAVERPEIIRYFNTMEANFTGKLLTVGAVFNVDGVGVGVRRVDEVTPHPVMGLLSAAVFDATRTAWRAEEQTRVRWFGEDVPFSEDALADLSEAGYTDVMVLLEYAMLAAFLFFALVSLIEFAFRYPRYKARNDTCAMVRQCLSLAARGSHEDYTMSRLVRRDRVRTGLSRLLGLIRSKGGVQGKLDSAVTAADGGLDHAGAGLAIVKRGSTLMAGEEALDVDQFSAHVGEAMGREQRAPGGVFTSLGKRLFGSAWDRVAAVNYSKHGPALVRGRFERSRLAVVQSADAGGDGRTMPLDEAVDVVLHMLAREERRWYREGSLIFAFRSDDPARDQVVSEPSNSTGVWPPASDLRLAAYVWGGRL